MKQVVGINLAARSVHYVVHRCACRGVRKLRCSCYFIVATEINVMAPDHLSSLLSVFESPSSGTRSFRNC